MRVLPLLLLLCALLFVARADEEDVAAVSANAEREALADVADAPPAEEAFYEDDDEEEEDEEEDLALDDELAAHGSGGGGGGASSGGGAPRSAEDLSPEEREMQMRLQQQMVRYVLETASKKCSTELRNVLGMTQVRAAARRAGVGCAARRASRRHAGVRAPSPRLPAPAGAAVGAAQGDGRQDVFQRVHRGDQRPSRCA